MAGDSTPTVGDKAPDFELPAFPMDFCRLSQFRGKKNVVLYFYPRDDTPGCTRQACGFRDQLASIQARDAVVIGVSTDSIAKHQRFAQKYMLPFALLADEDHTVAEKYGVWVEKVMYGKRSMGIERSTFLIDKSGKIVAVWRKVKVDGHADDVMLKLAELK